MTLLLPGYRYLFLSYLLTIKKNSITMSTEEQAAKAIPAEVHMISGCKDEQTSAGKKLRNFGLLCGLKKCHGIRRRVGSWRSCVSCVVDRTCPSLLKSNTDFVSGQSPCTLTLHRCQQRCFLSASRSGGPCRWCTH